MIWDNEVVSHLLVTFIYFLIISVLKLVTGEVALGWLGVLGILGMWGGAVLGTFFLDIDHLIYWFVTNTDKEDSKEARRLGRLGDLGIIKRFKELFELLKRVHFSHSRLIFHSVIGQVILLLLALYLITSGGSVFGAGMIMSINLHLLKDEWTDFFKNREHLKDWLFWQIKDNGIKENLKEYLIGASLVFLILTIIFI